MNIVGRDDGRRLDYSNSVIRMRFLHCDQLVYVHYKYFVVTVPMGNW